MTEISLQMIQKSSEIKKFLNENTEYHDSPIMFYAADDFDDFICFVQSVEVQKNQENKCHSDPTTMTVIWTKCFKSQFRRNAGDEQNIILKDQVSKAMKVKDFIAKLNEIDDNEDVQFTASTEKGKIYFLVTGMKTTELPTENNDLGITKMIIFDGNF